MKSMDVDDDDEDDRDDDDDDDEEASRREDALSVMDTCAGGENSLRLDSSIESNPLENELGDLLCIFTVQFLKHGFAQLVNNLQASLLRSNYNYNGISYEQAESYFLWTLMFFSKFAVMEEVGWDPVEPAYSAEIFSYLTYLAVDYSERYLVSLKIDESAARVYWKQLHNVLMAMYELLAVLDTFMMEEGLNGNKNFITSLQVRLTASYDIRMLYVLLIRLHKNNSNDDEQTLDFLSKAIMTNHRLLLMMENVVNSQNNAAAATTLTFNMLAHVKNFATESMMAQYGKLLTRFRQNTDFLNDCLLTMMHHVAGDCQQPNMLLQIPIIETFTAICDENHKLQENYDDLIDYTFSKFLVVAKTGFDEAIHSDATESSDWTLEETEKLSMYYLRYMDKPDMLTMVWSGLNLDKTHKTKNAVLARLTELGLVHFSDELTHSMLNDASVGEFDRERGDINDYISFCVQKLHKEKRSEHVEWLQNTLLEACYIKLGGSRLTRNSPQEEPVTLYYTKFGRCIPLLPYTDAQENVLSNKFFRHILVSFGFDLGERGEFPRIPHAFTANQLYEKAKLLTPEIDASRLKFTMDDLLAESSAKSTNYSKDFDEIMHDAAESFNRSTPHSPPAMPSSLWAMSIGRINNVVSQKTTNSQQRSPVAST
ncbi:protein timeless-like [Tubulanus polymorphus]|uniref:protein timeless-like n=1 Tax=Tubulanus polymorphus TaxID=672921 RepID=UPI003DA62165